jgi:hypothetical protein
MGSRASISASASSPSLVKEEKLDKESPARSPFPAEEAAAKLREHNAEVTASSKSVDVDELKAAVMRAFEKKIKELLESGRRDTKVVKKVTIVEKDVLSPEGKPYRYCDVARALRDLEFPGFTKDCFETYCGWMLVLELTS